MFANLRKYTCIDYKENWTTMKSFFIATSGAGTAWPSVALFTPGL